MRLSLQRDISIVMRRHPAVRIALVGDHDPSVTAHRANPLVLERVAETLGLRTEATWVGTETIDPAEPGARLGTAHGIWVVPGSPYVFDEGALAAIRFARESNTPFLGTCGGFQYAVIEYARNVRPMRGRAVSGSVSS